MRTRYSLAQFLELQDFSIAAVLLAKYGAYVPMPSASGNLNLLASTVRALDDRSVLSEVFLTQGDLRSRINPKYRYDQRERDLTACLLLDGYVVQDQKLIQTDPSISDAAPVEDDLITALTNCIATRKLDIIAKINDSAEAFRSTPPDYNAALVNARVALETLAADIAADAAMRWPRQITYNPSKWGEVIGYLRQIDEISIEEERGLAGVFGFLSPGSHRPIGIPQDQMTRLGRSLALNMCWFLIKNHGARCGC